MVKCVLCLQIPLEIEFKRRVYMGSHGMPAVSPMSGSPTFATEKKNTEKLSEANL